MVELGDEHGRHAVERGAAFGRDGFAASPPASKPSAGIDHGRAVGDAGEVAHHHAEAMVERHGDADPVAAGQAASPRRRRSRC